jgi:two-component system OmpR family sensor kinase
MKLPRVRMVRTLRARLALLFAGTTLVLCGLVGYVVATQFRSELRASLDDGLHNRWTQLESQLPSTPPGGALAPTILPDTESFAQVLQPDGTVLAAAPRALESRPVLRRDDLAKALQKERTFVQAAPPKTHSARLLAGPAELGGHRVVIVVGSSLDDANQAQDRLDIALAVGLPLLALAVSLGGWFLLGGALQPVRSMIEEADAISAAQLTIRAGSGPGRRLSVPRRGGDEIAELARRLNALLGRIEDAVAHERAFLDDASHELRTPISIARGEAELARMSVEDGTEAAAAVDSLLDEVERLDHLARNLLVLARSRTTSPGSWPEVDLADVAQRAVDGLQRAGAVAGVTVHVDGQGTVRGDESGLERAISNLVENALRVAQGRVDVVVGADETTATIEVRDDGPGFPSELLRGAFERFTKAEISNRAPRDLNGEPTDPARAVATAALGMQPAAERARPGAGLGLAIVAAIAAAHGGTASAENAPRGAVVRLVLPRQPS